MQNAIHSVLSHHSTYYYSGIGSIERTLRSFYFHRLKALAEEINHFQKKKNGHNLKCDIRVSLKHFSIVTFLVNARKDSCAHGKNCRFNGTSTCVSSRVTFLGSQCSFAFSSPEPFVSFGFANNVTKTTEGSGDENGSTTYVSSSTCAVGTGWI